MALFHNEKIKLFALNSNRKLAEEISNQMGIELSECQVTRFADGEVSVNISETVRGHKVFVIQSTSAPVNDNLMELLIFIDALKRASAREINIILPYYGYSRQDRKAQARQPISAKLVADLITVAGATRLICLDLHAAQIQGFFNIPIDNLTAMPLFAAYLKEQKLSNFVVVSPDHGGANRARKLAEYFDASIAIIDKRRPKPNVSEVVNIIGKVKNKNCVIVDDLIDTGGTIYNAAKALKKEGAKDIYILATHGLLSGGARKKLSNQELIKKVVVTNSIQIQEKSKFDSLDIVTVAPLIAQAITKVLDDAAMSPLFE